LLRHPFGGNPRRRPRRRRPGVIGAALAGAAVMVTLAGCAGSARARVPAPGPMVGTRLDASLPASVLHVPLVSPTGRTVRLSDFAGKVLVVSDVMTLCQETCPLDTANVVAAARQVEKAGLGDEVEFVSITVDPERDTPARLAAYRRLYGHAPRDWVTLTGDPASLALFWHVLGVYIQRVPDTPPAPKDWLTGKPLTYDITHSDELFFLGGQQRERFLLDGAPHVAAAAPIPPTIRAFMDAQGRADLARPDPQAWTLPQELQVIAWLTDHPLAGSSEPAATSPARH
jgi:protein SCO1